MDGMFRKAPTLAWLLAGLTCFLVGAFVGEGWSRAAPRPLLPTVGVVVTVEVAFQPTSTPEPTVRPEGPRLPTPDPEKVSPPPGSGGTGTVR